MLVCIHPLGLDTTRIDGISRVGGISRHQFRDSERISADEDSN